MTVFSIRRGFADVSCGQMHYRCAGTDHAGTPIVLLHGEPASSWVYTPLIEALAQHRPVYALDTIGMGDSDPCPFENPAVTDFASITAEAIENLFSNPVHLYGSLGGGRIAVEIALAKPNLAAKLVIDGVGVQRPNDQQDHTVNYVPDTSIDDHGRQFLNLFAFVRDQYLYWPWNARKVKNQRGIDLPAAQVLHDKTMEVLKGKDTLDRLTRTAFSHDMPARMALVHKPMLVSANAAHLVDGSKLLDLPRVEPVSASPEHIAALVSRIQDFLGPD